MGSFMLVDYILKKLGIRRSTLADIDTMAVGQVFGEEEPLLQFEKVYEMVNHCDLCGGRLLIVIPLVQMEDKVLCECESCKERVYRKP
jgi:hypothetical protein